MQANDKLAYPINRMNKLALTSLFFISIILFLFGILPFVSNERIITDQEVALFMKSNKYIEWPEDSQSIEISKLYPALRTWKESLLETHTNPLAIVSLLFGIVSFLSTLYLARKNTAA